MDITAHNRYVRMSARKVRLLADMIRGLDTQTALEQLRYMTRAARVPLEKTVRSAIASAENTYHVQKEHTFVKTITVDIGPGLQRWRPRAFGRAAPIIKHLCHITVVLGEKLDVEKRQGVVGTSKSAAPHSDEAQRVSPVASEKSISVAVAPANETRPTAADGEKEIFDTAREGRHEYAQKLNREQKKQKGFLKKVFHRKSG
ncbi:50S ribosomal protein L22 [Candidatus Uhrbacteria bacterium]|nr:50S ribosomal protein L22 [Candidatus Uhrbacteria bacterium]